MVNGTPRDLGRHRNKLFQGRNGPEQIMDTWRDVDQAFKSKIRLDKTDFWGKKMSSCLLFGRREQDGEKEKVQDFFLRSWEFRQSEFV